MPRCQIGLGGNLGCVPETFRRALDLLSDSRVKLRAVSRFYRTSAVGGRADGVFLNAAASLDTWLTPLELLNRLQTLEAQLGRTREVHWGSRTIDLDLLFYGDESFETPRLTVPHPACWYRRFVLDPLTEIAPDLIHPVKQLSIRGLRERLLPRPLPVVLAGADMQVWSGILDRLTADFPLVQFFHWPASTDEDPRGSPVEPAFIFWWGNQRLKCGDDPGFAALPALPRVDVPTTPVMAEEFVRSVLQSALDEPIVSD